jgi:hypothetical protein
MKTVMIKQNVYKFDELPENIKDLIINEYLQSKLEDKDEKEISWNEWETLWEDSKDEFYKICQEMEFFENGHAYEKI